MPVAADHIKFIRKGRLSGIVAIALFLGSVLLAPFGKFFVWICIGAMFYSIFFSLYNFALARQLGKPYAHQLAKKPISGDLKAYMAYHLPIVISILLGGLAVALAIVFFTR